MPGRPPDPPTPARRPWRWAVLVVLAVLVVFGRSAAFDFVDFDDNVHLLANRYMNPFTAGSLARFWRGPYGKLYIPATYTAWGLMTHVARVPAAAAGRPTLDPAVFHLANVVLHAANAVLVWLILRRVIGDDGWPAAAGALVFALHPVQAEPVAWVSGFKDTFSGFWSLLAIVLLLRAVGDPFSRRACPPLQRPAGGPAKRDALLPYVAATAAFIVAMCAKPAAVVVPPIAWLLAWAAGDLRPRRTAGLLLPWVILAAPYVWVTQHRQSEAVLMAWNPPAVRPLVALDAMAFYARHVVWPVGLAVDYGRTPRWVWDHAGSAAIGIAATISAAAALLWAGRRGRTVAAGLAVFAVAVAPVSGLVPFLYQQFSTVSDRYLYLSMAGVALVVGGAVRALGRQGAGIGGFVFVVLAGLSFAQVGVWRDSASLFRHTLSVNPDSAISHAGLGLLAERANDWPAAEAAFRAATRADPSEPKYQGSLWWVLSHEPGRSADAEAQHARYLAAAARRVLTLDPDSPLAHRTLSQAYDLQGRRADAAFEAGLAARLAAAGHADLRPTDDEQ